MKMTSENSSDITLSGQSKFGSQGSSFFFDFHTVMDRCEALRRNPERVALMCQAQVRQIAPEELVIPNKNGFHLIVRSRFGAAAEALAGEINLALQHRLFGSEPLPEAISMFRG